MEKVRAVINNSCGVSGDGVYVVWLTGTYIVALGSLRHPFPHTVI